ncbi:flagellar motor switch protein FliM [Ammoniphilus oxalaticus]|uniref:Flagellar motor switch protein FliM n=1 Tax=Ammoniphilus oxalaticus TaxID=66863 RepID=A0A419SJT9_9BACL|nr:flagellar motor switch protein FliM [Ammoniphilus oxalaticus]RKD24247.1 flagellar motor switch protein FliM [Ammoniphilus oxalaticus]
MADVLSQHEIDALLTAISTGDLKEPELEEPKKIKIYDFKRAVRFSKDQIRNLVRLHEGYARLLTSFFSAQLRTFARVSVASVDQLSYEEFMRSIPEKTVLSTFEGKGIQGLMLMEMSPYITYAILDRLFGGSGSPTDMELSNGLTEIEVSVLERMNSRILDLFHESWQDLMEVDPQLLELETNPQFVQIVPPNETVIVISFSVEIGETSGLLNFCLPYVVLEPIIPKLTTQQLFSMNRREKTEQEGEGLKDSMQRVELPLVAELGATRISIQDFLNLEAGDVIQLDQPVDSMLNLKVGPEVKFQGYPGERKGRLAIRIERAFSEGVDKDE